MVAPLSYTSQYGYYHLRVNPTYEQVVGTVRKPLRIPLPDRKEKWYANSVYRAFLEDAGKKFEEVEGAAHMYRESGAELPESAAQVRRSDEGNDQTFDRIHQHGDRMDQNDTYEASYEVTRQEEKRKTIANRREVLSKSYGPNRMDPTIEAAHLELLESNVHHYMPKIRTLPPNAVFTRPLPAMVARGQPQAPEFPSFELLNMGQPENLRAATMTLSQNSTYERIRDYVVEPTFSS
jgi:hypothetical protein